MVGPEATPQSRRGDGARGRHGPRGRANTSTGRGRGARDRAARDRAQQPLNPAARDVAAAAARAHARLDDPQRSADVNTAASADQGHADDDDAAEVCFICANPIAHHSIAPCNHTTCHICGLRMRALYKTKDCAHCRTPAPFVIFTDDAGARFQDYSAKDITTTDSNIGIKYTNEDIVGDTVLLLRYNCPDPSCDFAGLGWPDLHRHVKSAHSKRMCDLCTRNKKVFTHEHELFAGHDLERHMRQGDDKPGAADQTGFKGHPLCEFCGERFYDDDKLYDHCRMKHERCFICDRQDSRTPHYYRDYDSLEQHFKRDHYLCSNADCLEKKFVVFESEMDLQAHQLSEHAGKAVGRDARVVDMSAFDIRPSYQQERRGGQSGRGQRDAETRGRGRGRGGGGGGGGGGGRGRDPNGEPLPPTSAQPLRRDELAFQRQMAIHSAQSVSNRTFGGQLTPSPAQAPASRQPSRSSTPRGPSASAPPGQNSGDESPAVADASNPTPEERARLLRHNSVVERASSLLANDAARLAEFREHISSYRRGALTSPQLIDALFTLFGDVSSNALGTLVREVADLFEDKAKADNLRKAWQDWRAINEDYPSLPGLSGMHGATSSSSGWATASAANPAVPNAAPSQKHSTRVLKLKNSTRLGGPSPVSPRGPPGWAAAAPASSSSASSAAFPSLSAANRPTASSSGPASRPSWTASASQTAPSSRTATPPLGGRGGEAFPALPAAQKPMTTLFGYGSGRGVRRDYGQAASGFQWGSAAASGPGGGAAAGAPAQDGADDDAGEASGGGKGKKGGKKGKKVLVQWG